MAASSSIKQLGILIKSRREAAGYSTRALGAKAGVNDSTIVRLEQGLRDNPSPDVLTKIAGALHLKLADVFSLAGYAVPQELPTLPAYLRVKYRHLPQPARDELVTYMRHLYTRYGLDEQEIA
jgi:transcriptional regulator with XRE-family HTH domain